MYVVVAAALPLIERYIKDEMHYGPERFSSDFVVIQALKRPLGCASLGFRQSRIILCLQCFEIFGKFLGLHFVHVAYLCLALVLLESLPPHLILL